MENQKFQTESHKFVMCFSQPMSGAFALLGLVLTYWIYSRTCNYQLASGAFFFFVMEFLQFLQYFWIDQCDNPINQFLTWFGFVHICLQPYFTHVINASLTKNKIKTAQWHVIKKLALIGGGLLFLRWFNHEHWIQEPPLSAEEKACSKPSTEWLRGDKLCTYSGDYHLAWSVPFTTASYSPFNPGIAIHSFMMFAPFFIMEKCWIQGIFLYISGPFLGGLITDNLQEQASIWCFFSIVQIGIMIFVIREVLILHWGRQPGDVDLHSSIFAKLTGGGKVDVDSAVKAKPNGKAN